MNITLIARRKTDNPKDIIQLKMKNEDMDILETLKNHRINIDLDKLSEEDSQREVLKDIIRAINLDKGKLSKEDLCAITMFQDFLTETVKNKLSIFQLNKNDKGSAPSFEILK